MVLDIGHVRNSEVINPMTLPGGPLKILDLCCANLHFLHLHGFVDRDHYPLFAEGDRIQWTELFQKLYDPGKTGLLIFSPKEKIFMKTLLRLPQWRLLLQQTHPDSCLFINGIKNLSSFKTSCMIFDNTGRPLTSDASFY